MSRFDQDQAPLSPGLGHNSGTQPPKPMNMKDDFTGAFPSAKKIVEDARHFAGSKALKIC